MALFRDRPIRSVASVAAVLFVAHVVSLFVSFFHVFHLTQASVAILAVSGMIFLVAMHHRREGHLLTQTQEEMVLIFCFGLWWMSMLLGWRALKTQGGSPGLVGEVNTGVPVVPREMRRPSAGMVGQIRPYPCSYDDAYCQVVEEYTFF